MRRKLLGLVVLFSALLVLPGCWLRAAVDPEGALKNPRGGGQKEEKKEEKKKEPAKEKVEEKS